MHLIKKHWSSFKIKLYLHCYFFLHMHYTVNEYVTYPRVNASALCGNATVTVRVPSWQVMNGVASNVYPTSMPYCSNASYSYSSWDRTTIVLVVPFGACGATLIVRWICHWLDTFYNVLKYKISVSSGFILRGAYVVTI